MNFWCRELIFGICDNFDKILIRYVSGVEHKEVIKFWEQIKTSKKKSFFDLVGNMQEKGIKLGIFKLILRIGFSR